MSGIFKFCSDEGAVGYGKHVWSAETGLLQVCHARIANVEIPNSKCIRYSLQYIYGVGDTSAQKILQSASIDPTKRTYELSEEELGNIRDQLENFIVEGDLRRTVSMNIKRYVTAK